MSKREEKQDKLQTAVNTGSWLTGLITRPASDSRRIDDQPVPLSFDVIIRRLLRDVKAGEF